MSGRRTSRVLLAALMVLLVLAIFRIPPFAPERDATAIAASGRKDVVFWHFWGGGDREVVERVVARFNKSQSEYSVRAIAMPGNNLDLKVFLSVAGGDPPDVINQDDQILGDWASRGALLPLTKVASRHEIQQLQTWLLPAARELGTYQGTLYALCNGLDIRALYYNNTWLGQRGYSPPATLADLDQLAVKLTERNPRGDPVRVGFLPDPRRLWAWGIVFGGDFYDEERQQITPTDPRIVTALEWMASYRKPFGADDIAAFRRGDQSLPGAGFPLLPANDGTKGRYAILMDGQWRVRDIAAWQKSRAAAGLANVEFGVCPLPPPPGGHKNAGWVNGNFFIIPRNARNARGAWQFMKFWSGFAGQEREAAQTCAEGGWLPVSERVIAEPRFQQLLIEEPLLNAFVELSRSPQQLPIPVIPGAAAYKRAIEEAAERAMSDDAPTARQLLDNVRRRVQPLVTRGLQGTHGQPQS